MLNFLTSAFSAVKNFVSSAVSAAVSFVKALTGCKRAVAIAGIGATVLASLFGCYKFLKKKHEAKLDPSNLTTVENALANTYRSEEGIKTLNPIIRKKLKKVLAKDMSDKRARRLQLAENKARRCAENLKAISDAAVKEGNRGKNHLLKKKKCKVLHKYLEKSNTDKNYYLNNLAADGDCSPNKEYSDVEILKMHGIHPENYLNVAPLVRELSKEVNIYDQDDINYTYDSIRNVLGNEKYRKYLGERRTNHENEKNAYAKLIREDREQNIANLANHLRKTLDQNPTMHFPYTEDGEMPEETHEFQVMDRNEARKYTWPLLSRLRPPEEFLFKDHDKFDPDKIIKDIEESNIERDNRGNVIQNPYYQVKDMITICKNMGIGDIASEVCLFYNGASFTDTAYLPALFYNVGGQLIKKHRDCEVNIRDKDDNIVKHIDLDRYFVLDNLVTTLNAVLTGNGVKRFLYLDKGIFKDRPSSYASKYVSDNGPRDMTEEEIDDQILGIFNRRLREEERKASGEYDEDDDDDDEYDDDFDDEDEEDEFEDDEDDEDDDDAEEDTEDKGFVRTKGCIRNPEGTYYTRTKELRKRKDDRINIPDSSDDDEDDDEEDDDDEYDSCANLDTLNIDDYTPDDIDMDAIRARSGKYENAVLLNDAESREVIRKALSGELDEDEEEEDDEDEAEETEAAPSGPIPSEDALHVEKSAEVKTPAMMVSDKPRTELDEIKDFGIMVGGEFSITDKTKKANKTTMPKVEEEGSDDEELAINLEGTNDGMELSDYAANITENEPTTHKVAMMVKENPLDRPSLSERCRISYAAAGANIPFIANIKLSGELDDEDNEEISGTEYAIQAYAYVEMDDEYHLTPREYELHMSILLMALYRFGLDIKGLSSKQIRRNKKLTLERYVDAEIAEWNAFRKKTLMDVFNKGEDHIHYYPDFKYRTDITINKSLIDALMNTFSDRELVKTNPFFKRAMLFVANCMMYKEKAKDEFNPNITHRLYRVFIDDVYWMLQQHPDTQNDVERYIRMETMEFPEESSEDDKARHAVMVEMTDEIAKLKAELAKVKADKKEEITEETKSEEVATESKTDEEESKVEEKVETEEKKEEDSEVKTEGALENQEVETTEQPQK